MTRPTTHGCVRLVAQVDDIDVSADAVTLLVRRAGRGCRAPLVLLKTPSLQVLAEFGRGLPLHAQFTVAGNVIALLDTGDGEPALHAFGSDGAPLPLDDKDPLVLAWRAAPRHQPVLHADATHLCIAGTYDVQILMADGGSSGVVLPLPQAAGIRHAAGRWWVRAAFGRGMFVFDAQGNAVALPSPLNDAGQTITAFDVTTDGALLVIGNAAGYVRVHEVSTGERRWGARLHRGHVTAARWAPDGRVAYTGSASGELCRTEPD